MIIVLTFIIADTIITVVVVVLVVVACLEASITAAPLPALSFIVFGIVVFVVVRLLLLLIAMIESKCSFAFSPPCFASAARAAMVFAMQLCSLRPRDSPPPGLARCFSACEGRPRRVCGCARPRRFPGYVFGMSSAPRREVSGTVAHRSGDSAVRTLPIASGASSVWTTSSRTLLWTRLFVWWRPFGMSAMSTDYSGVEDEHQVASLV